MPTILKNKRNYKKEPRYYKRKERMKVYNSSLWKTLRESKLMENPLCEVCQMQGKITLAEDVHHVNSFMKYEGNERDAVAFDFDNLICLCRSCHWACHNGYLLGCESREEIEERVKRFMENEKKNDNNVPQIDT